MMVGRSLYVRIATGNRHRESGRAGRSGEPVLARGCPVDVITVPRTETSVRGVVPESALLKQAKNYYSGLVSEDVFSIKDLPLRRDEQRARKLLRSYSRCISSEASNESIKADLSQNGDSIDKDTFVIYMLVLQRLYVVEELEAWNPNLSR